MDRSWFSLSRPYYIIFKYVGETPYVFWNLNPFNCMDFWSVYHGHGPP